MALLLGIDLGTSYFKIGLFDETGAVRGLSRVAVERREPLPGHHELPTAAFWQLLRHGLAEALAQAGAEARQIAGLSYSSQANTFLLLDGGGEPLTPLVLWTDVRAEALTEEVAAFSRVPDFSRIVGFEELSGAWAVAKIRWFQREKPELWDRTRRVMTISDYFTFALTGETAGDAGTAALLGLYDLTARQWWPRALEAFGLAGERLSLPLLPGTPCGRTSAKAAELLGLPAGIAFAVGGLDHQIAALGSGIGRFADMSISTGTVLAAMILAPDVRPQSGCYHGPHTDGATYFRLAFDPMGAGQLEDYQRDFAPQYSLLQLFALAESASSGGAAGWNPDRNATDRGHGASVRFLLEKIAVSHRTLVGRVAGGSPVGRIVATGGGARSTLWLQIKADIIGVPIVTSACQERACLGAAMLSGIAAGAFASAADASRAMVHEAGLYMPNPPR